MMKRILLSIICITTIMTSCHDNTIEISDPQVILSPVEVFINTEIVGYVHDGNGAKISEYNLQINESELYIEEDGFELALIDAKKKGQTIHVIKDGEQIGIKTQLLIENDRNKVIIEKHNPINKIKANTSTKIDLSYEVAINFNGVEWQSGFMSEFDLQYLFIDQHINLTSIGYTQDLDVYSVDSRGGFYIKAKDSNGDLLYPTSSNEITVEIGNLDVGTNALFRFDDAREIWILVQEIEENQSLPIYGNSYYTFGSIEKGVFVEGIVQKEGNPIAYQTMEAKFDNLGLQYFSTISGKWITVLPENTSVALALINPCQEQGHMESISTDATDESGVVIDVSSEDNLLLIEEPITGCEQEEITNPQITLSNTEITETISIPTGASNVWIPVCEDMSITAADEDGTQGPSYAVNSAVLSQEGTLSACSEYTEGYSRIMVKMDPKDYGPIEIKMIDGAYSFQSQDEKFKIILPAIESRQYAPEEVNIYINDSDFGSRGYFIDCEESTFSCGVEELELIEDEEWIIITFKGAPWMQTISPPFAGNFPIEGKILIQK